MQHTFKDNLFSFDLGSNSIGWCVFKLDKQQNAKQIIDMGVRIFSDGRDARSKTSLAVNRREKRGAARRRDRYLRRRNALLKTLTDYGLMPQNDDEIKKLLHATSDATIEQTASKNDLYNLRSRALYEQLPLYFIGRIFFHLNQRRGFKSNRKTDKKINDKGKIAIGVDNLRKLISDHNAQTLGEYLAMRRNNGCMVRMRAGSQVVDDNNYAFHPERAMIEDEFKKIWQAQAQFYPDILTDIRAEHIFKIIFFQRSLKKTQIGKCSYNTNEDRLAKADPLFQKMRLYKEVNELTIIDQNMNIRKLTLDERNSLISLLHSKKKRSFNSLRKKLHLKTGERFNKESDNRKDLIGDEVYASLSDKKAFGVQWTHFNLETQQKIITKLLQEEETEELEKWLMDNFLLSQETCTHIIKIDLPSSYGRLGKTATNAIYAQLQQDVISEAKAAKLCNYNHTLFDKEQQGHDTLPPYQEVLDRQIPRGTANPNDPYDIAKGRITNPTVHIGLNQLRRLCNRLITRHGKPITMVVEIARDIALSDKQRNDTNKIIAKNTTAAKARSQILADMGVKDNGYNQQLLKLWEELHEKPNARLCIYSGEPISMNMLFSDQVDIDHILPWSCTLDDGQANKILCLRAYNRIKGNRTPAQVVEWQDKYSDILARVQALPKNKQWRFANDAMEQFNNNGDFLARQLTDTQYLSRLAFAYLSCLYPAEEIDETGELKRRNHVRVVPGRLTEMLRRNWGLNSLLPDKGCHPKGQPKNRNDHRHHAIDAAVVGVTSHALLQRISTLAAKTVDDNENYYIHDLMSDVISQSLPWPHFCSDLEQALKNIIVSHKPDHGTMSRASDTKKNRQTAAQLHNETALGFTRDIDKKGIPIMVSRKAFLSLRVKDIANIRDENLQTALVHATYGLKDKDFTNALLHFSKNNKQYKGIRRVRLLQKSSVIAIKDKNGKIYKAYKPDSNYCFNVWQTQNGDWLSEIVSTYQAHQPHYQSFIKQQHPTARKILSLKKNDMVAYHHPENSVNIARIVKFSGHYIYMVAHNEANVDQRDKNKDDPLKYYKKTASTLKTINLRQIRVDEAGKVFDPGPLN